MGRRLAQAPIATVALGNLRRVLAPLPRPQVLNRQFKHFQLMRGLRGLSSKVLMVEGITPEQCYGRVFDAVKKSLVIKDRKVEPQAVALV